MSDIASIGLIQLHNEVGRRASNVPMQFTGFELFVRDNSARSVNSGYIGHLGR